MSYPKGSGSRPLWAVTGQVAVAVLLIGAPLLAGAAAAAPGTANAVPPGTTGPALVAALGRPAATATVPSGAFLQPTDGVEAEPAPDDLRPYLRPPRPCANRVAYRSAAQRLASGAVFAVYPVAERPTVLLEHIDTYRGNGAARYLSELRRAVPRHGGCADQGRRWTVVATGLAGQQSLLLRLREPFVDPGGDKRVQSMYVFVGRVGQAVVTLADLGWESGNGHPSVVRALAAPAIRRALVGLTAPFAAGYRVTDLGTFGGAASRPYGINDRGDVVGWAETADGARHPFLWRAGRLTDLGTLRPAPDDGGIAADVNARGDAVGGSGIGDQQHAVLWRGGRITDLGTLGGSYSFATAINDRGQVAGNSTTPDGEMHGFLWRNGRMTDLGVGGFTVVTDLNNRGEVVGWSAFGPEGTGRSAYLWRRGHVVRLTAGGGAANAVNDRGIVVGATLTPEGVARATAWWRGRTTDLGTLPGGNASGAIAINDRGAILGTGNLQPYSAEEHPLIWYRGTLTDLAAYGAPPSASAINDRGQLIALLPVGAGDAAHAALYTPVRSGR